MIYLNPQIYSQLEAASVDIELEKKDLQSFVYLFDEGGAERKQVSNATRISRNMKKKKEVSKPTTSFPRLLLLLLNQWRCWTVKKTLSPPAAISS